MRYMVRIRFFAGPVWVVRTRWAMWAITKIRLNYLDLYKVLQSTMLGKVDMGKFQISNFLMKNKSFGHLK